MGPLEVPLPRDLSGPDGQQAPRLLKPRAQWVQVMVKDHQKPLADVVRQPGPEEGHRPHAGSHLPQQPQGVHPRRPQHHQIDGQVHRHHPNVPGHPVHQGAQRQHMEQQQSHRLGPVEPLLPLFLQLQGQQEQEGHLHHLPRLEVEQPPRQGQPALVAGAVVVAEGDQEQQQPCVQRGQQPP